MKIKTNFLSAAVLAVSISTLFCGCTVVSQNRVFPKLTWYWSDDAKAERAYGAQEKVDK